MELTISDFIEIISIFTSLLTSIVAIVISIIALKQNSKMIEESSRAIIGIYSDSVNPGTPMLYLVIKNFGNSVAIITKFDYDFDFSECYCYKAERDYLKDLTNCSIAPNQSRICRLDYQKLSRPVKFDIEYLSCGKKYSDSFTVDLKAGVTMPNGKYATENKELKSISYTLQEMLTKHLLSSVLLHIPRLCLWRFPKSIELPPSIISHRRIY